MIRSLTALALLIAPLALGLPALAEEPSDEELRREIAALRREAELLRVEAEQLKLESELRALEVRRHELEVRRRELELYRRRVVAGEPLQGEQGDSAPQPEARPEQPEPTGKTPPVATDGAKYAWLLRDIRALLVEVLRTELARRAAQREPSEEERAAGEQLLARLKAMALPFAPPQLVKIATALNAPQDRRAQLHSAALRRVASHTEVAVERGHELPRLVALLLRDERALRREPLRALVLDHLLEQALAEPRPAQSADALVSEADHLAAAGRLLDAARCLVRARKQAPDHEGAQELARAIEQRVASDYRALKQRRARGELREPQAKARFVAAAAQCRDILIQLRPRHALIAVITEDIRRAQAKQADTR